MRIARWLHGQRLLWGTWTIVGIVVVLLGGLLLVRGLLTPAGEESPSPGSSIGPIDAGAGPGPNGVQLAIPWAIGGERIESDGSLVDFPGEWPDVAVNAIRLWDTRTAWLNLEPANGAWDFTRLDAYVKKAEDHGVGRILLTLGGTPRWAARGTSATEAAWMGPGSSSPPSDMADWDDYVRTVVTRYAGRITAYEIWNEPSGNTFWSGTSAEWADLVSRAVPIIHSIDPAASVVASGFVLGGVWDVPRLTPWLSELAAVHPDLTAISVHWYPKAGGDVSRMRAVTRQLRAQLLALGLPGRIWVTEANVIDGSGLSAAGQRAAIRSLDRQARALGVRHLYWYAWSDLVSPSLIPLYEGTPGAQELAAIVRRQAAAGRG